MQKLFLTGLLLSSLATLAQQNTNAAPTGTVSPNASQVGQVVPSTLSAEEQAVHDAVLDYVEAIYRTQPGRIERSVHPTLRKYGYIRGDREWRGTPMTFDQLREFAATYNVNGRISADAPKAITIFEVLDQTASARLVATWGIDYLHLAKIDGRWQIMNVIWQTPPRR